MGQAALISQDLNTQLNSWNAYILENDIQNATKMKENITKQLDYLTVKDSSLFLQAKLIELNFYLLIKDNEKAEESMNIIEPYEEVLTEELKFYYHFYMGHYAYLQGNYELSITKYEHAVKYIDHIEDNFLHAEYHYKIMATYYFNSQMIFSLTHLEQANDLFNLSDKKNIIRSADCQMAYGLIYIDMKQYDLAEEKFHTAYMYSKKINDVQLVNRVLHNLGFFYAEQRLSEAAIRYLKPVINRENERSYEHYIRALFLMYREYCRNRMKEEALECLNNALSYLEKNVNKEYMYKFQLVKVLYLNDINIDNELFEESITYFRQKKLWDSVESYSKLIAQAYSKASYLEQAVYYYELAQTASHTIFEMEALK
ncbi:hypothetical protein [Pseudalkalibacillus decolorationis]|uniref:hypothetical protein n=1 Tax=Pseudalkalibacillus decolorationis TaxID=163879 RepID=UPI002148F228|nr:hypothetical protein [Pseudalkalibacillus decolorationis]